MSDRLSESIVACLLGTMVDDALVLVRQYVNFTLLTSTQL